MASSLSPGPLFQQTGLNQTATPVPLTATSDEIHNKYSKVKFSEGNDWPPDSPAAGVYDISNTPASLIILNNKQKNKARLRGKASTRPMSAPETDRHSRENSPRKNNDRHSYCMDSTTPVYKAPKSPRKKSPNKKSQDSSSSTNRRRHVSCRVSSDPTYLSLEYALKQLTRNQNGIRSQTSRPPSSLNSSYSINHPALSLGNKKYLWSIANVYGIDNMKQLAQVRYRELLTRQQYYGFHSQEEYKKYVEFLNRRRERAKSTNNDSSNTSTRTGSPSRSTKDKSKKSSKQSEANEKSNTDKSKRARPKTAPARDRRAEQKGDDESNSTKVKSRPKSSRTRVKSDNNQKEDSNTKDDDKSVDETEAKDDNENEKDKVEKQICDGNGDKNIVAESDKEDADKIEDNTDARDADNGNIFDSENGNDTLISDETQLNKQEAFEQLETTANDDDKDSKRNKSNGTSFLAMVMDTPSANQSAVTEDPNESVVTYKSAIDSQVSFSASEKSDHKLVSRRGSDSSTSSNNSRQKSTRTKHTRTDSRSSYNSSEKSSKMAHKRTDSQSSISSTETSSKVANKRTDSHNSTNSTDKSWKITHKRTDSYSSISSTEKSSKMMHKRSDSHSSISSSEKLPNTKHKRKDSHDSNSSVECTNKNRSRRGSDDSKKSNTSYGSYTVDTTKKDVFDDNKDAQDVDNGNINDSEKENYNVDDTVINTTETTGNEINVTKISDTDIINFFGERASDKTEDDINNTNDTPSTQKQQSPKVQDIASDDDAENVNTRTELESNANDKSDKSAPYEFVVREPTIKDPLDGTDIAFKELKQNNDEDVAQSSSSDSSSESSDSADEFADDEGETNTKLNGQVSIDHDQMKTSQDADDDTRGKAFLTDVPMPEERPDIQSRDGDVTVSNDHDVNITQDYDNKPEQTYDTPKQESYHDGFHRMRFKRVETKLVPAEQKQVAPETQKQLQDGDNDNSSDIEASRVQVDTNISANLEANENDGDKSNNESTNKKEDESAAKKEEANAAPKQQNYYDGFHRMRFQRVETKIVSANPETDEPKIENGSTNGNIENENPETEKPKIETGSVNVNMDIESNDDSSSVRKTSLQSKTEIHVEEEHNQSRKFQTEAPETEPEIANNSLTDPSVNISEPKTYSYSSVTVTDTSGAEGTYSEDPGMSRIEEESGQLSDALIHGRGRINVEQETSSDSKSNNNTQSVENDTEQNTQDETQYSNVRRLSYNNDTPDLQTQDNNGNGRFKSENRLDSALSFNSTFPKTDDDSDAESLTLGSETDKPGAEGTLRPKSRLGNRPQHDAMKRQDKSAPSPIAPSDTAIPSPTLHAPLYSNMDEDDQLTSTPIPTTESETQEASPDPYTLDEDKRISSPYPHGKRHDYEDTDHLTIPALRQTPNEDLMGKPQSSSTPCLDNIDESDTPTPTQLPPPSSETPDSIFTEQDRSPLLTPRRPTTPSAEVTFSENEAQTPRSQSGQTPRLQMSPPPSPTIVEESTRSSSSTYQNQYDPQSPRQPSTPSAEVTQSDGEVFTPRPPSSPPSRNRPHPLVSRPISPRTNQSPYRASSATPPSSPRSENSEPPSPVTDESRLTPRPPLEQKSKENRKLHGINPNKSQSASSEDIGSKSDQRMVELKLDTTSENGLKQVHSPRRNLGNYHLE